MRNLTIVSLVISLAYLISPSVAIMQSEQWDENRHRVPDGIFQQREPYRHTGFRDYLPPAGRTPYYGYPRRSGSSNHQLAKSTHSLSDSVQVGWISHYASELAPSSDVAKAIVLDKSGNVFVTGYSTKLPYGIDIITLKYDSLGSVIWTNRYNGVGDGDDLASAMSIDSDGNVYVTGRTWAGVSFDYVTLKYSSSGNLEWVAHFDGSGGFNDEADAVGVDDAGNVYVTGTSEHLETGEDIVTVKYDSSGVEQWVVRYNGPGNDYDNVRAMAVDNSGNVYITGQSIGLDINLDYTTIKYDTDGVELWVAIYNGAGKSFDFSTDIAFDGTGNAYVTGYSEGDYATIKYDTDGVEQWVARYSGTGYNGDWAHAIAVDNSGNVYVTGQSDDLDTGNDYATIKYDSAGVQLWVERYNGPTGYIDIANSIALDSYGNVYVTGYSHGPGTNSDYATIKYDSVGSRQWVVRYDGPGNEYDEASAIAVDGSGNVYLTGRSQNQSGRGRDYATVKYNSSGAEQWVARYSGPGTSRNYARDLAIDDAGNVYVTGISEDSVTGRDFVTVKYDPSGVEQWVARYNGTGNNYDHVTAIAVDNSGNVYVTGESDGLDANRDFATVKYNSSGVEQWVARYNAPGNQSDTPFALEVDRWGNVYVAGAADHSLSDLFETNKDYTIVKYSSDGVEQWVVRYDGPGNSSDFLSGMAVDAVGNIYVTGFIYSSDSQFDYATVKYNSEGVEQWVARYNGPANFNDIAEQVAVDNSGNVYVTGSSSDSDHRPNMVTIKYGPNGNEQWVMRHDNSRGIALVIDDLENVYVTGGSDGDFMTVKYSPGGVEEWIMIYDSPGGYRDNPVAITVDGSGDVYVTGNSQSYPYGECATVKYSSSGVEQWVARYIGAGNCSAVAVAADRFGDIYVSGMESGLGWGVFTTIKYVQDENIAIPERSDLMQNYPNPFNNSTAIRFTLTEPGYVTLKIYNLLGQDIQTFINDARFAGEYEFHWNPTGLPSGIYFYRLQAGDFVQTRKMVLLK